MSEEATVDAHDESEQATGWFTMLEQHLALPFETQVLGITVSVAKIDLGNDDRISVICTRGRYRQAIRLDQSANAVDGRERGGPIRWLGLVPVMLRAARTTQAGRSWLGGTLSGAAV